jgi:hypothetical protein
MAINKAAYRAAIAKKKAAAAKAGVTKPATKPAAVSQRAINDAVKKASLAQLETYFTNFGVTFDTTVAQATGTYAVGGFQASNNAASSTMANFFGNTGNAHVVHLPAQIVTGTAAGYRKGQFISPLGFRWWVRGYMQNATDPHDFHFCLARNKSNTIPAAVQQYPTYGSMASLSLFETGAFGPNAGSFISGSTRAEVTDATRFNKDVWDIKKHERVNVLPVANQELGNTSGVYRRMIQHDGYYKFPDKEWDYIVNTGSGSIKGGDYYLIMWNQNGESASAPNGGSPVLYMQVNMELSFKDA